MAAEHGAGGHIVVVKPDAVEVCRSDQIHLVELSKSALGPLLWSLESDRIHHTLDRERWRIGGIIPSRHLGFRLDRQGLCPSRRAVGWGRWR